MNLTKAKREDIPAIMAIVNDAKAYLKKEGIPQWQNGYPNEETFEGDIEKGILYVLKEEEEILSVFAMLDYESDYDYIEGAWKDDSPYIVIHRIAVKEERKGQNIAGKIFTMLEEEHPHIRIDTHEKNRSMNRCLLKNGFTYCGVIYLKEDGAPRNAYEYSKRKQ